MERAAAGQGAGRTSDLETHVDRIRAKGVTVETATLSTGDALWLARSRYALLSSYGLLRLHVCTDEDSILSHGSENNVTLIIPVGNYCAVKKRPRFSKLCNH